MAPAYPHSPTFLGPESPTGVPTPCEYCHQQGVHFGFLIISRISGVTVQGVDIYTLYTVQGVDIYPLYIRQHQVQSSDTRRGRQTKTPPGKEESFLLLVKITKEIVLF